MKKLSLHVFVSLVFGLTMFAAVPAQAQTKMTAKRTSATAPRLNKPTDEEFLDAVSDLNWAIVRQMILRGANVNAAKGLDYNSWTALHHTAYNQQSELVALLLQKGADVTILEADGKNALHNAVTGCECDTVSGQAQTIKIIELLAKNKTNPDAVDSDGDTPLMLAIHEKLPIVKAVLAAGADINFTNRFGENAAYLVKTEEIKDPIATFILSQSAPSSGAITEKVSDADFIKTLDSANWDRAKRMIAAGANVNAVKGDEKESALHYAAVYHNLEIIKLLVEKGARVNVINEHNGMTPLHRAFSSHLGVPSYELVQYLLDHGADPNAKMTMQEKWRPLSSAISYGNIPLIKLLLAHGADPNLDVSETGNALDEARETENQEVVALIKPLVKDTIAERRKNLPGKFIETAKNIEIYYEIYGADKPGTPLVVLHGGPGFDHQYFLTNSIFTELAKNRPVLFYDQRGTGFSSPLTQSQTSTVKDQLMDLTSLVNQLGYEKFDLFGHSWGGFLAMLYAEAFPKRLSHLILCDTMPPDYANFDNYSSLERDYAEEYRQWRQKGIEGMMGHDAQAMRDSQIAYMKMLFHSPEKRDSFIAASGNFTYNARVNQDVNSDADNFDLTKNLRAIAVPTLIMHGKYDSNIKPQVAETLHAKIPKSEIVIFEDSGHLPFYEEPEKFIRLLEAFLDEM